MPFKSKAQQRFMFSQHPEMAKEWADKTPDISKLPEHVKKMAFGGETNPEHETVKAMENNPTAGFADGGMAEPQDIDQQGLQTPPEVMAALGMLAGGANAAEDVPEMLGNETGSISLGGNAPEMEGMAPKVEAYVKGIQKGGSAPVKIWGVKGDPAEIEKLGFGPDPASIPEHILRQHGILPEMQVEVPGQNAPNSFAEGGEVPTLGSENPILAKLKALLSTKPIMNDQSQVSQADAIDPVVTSTATPHMADGGDISAALQQLIGSPIGQAANMAMNPFGAAMNALDTPTGQNMVNTGLQRAGNIMNMATGVRPQPPIPSAGAPDQTVGPVPPGGPTQGPSLTTPPGGNPAPAQTPPQQAPQQEPNLYQGITAQDRAALAQKLLGQQASSGNLAVSGAAGLGDAISNSFGKGGANFQNNIRENMAKNREAQIGITDTERGQRMQDLQANLAVQENDPASAYSKGMRAFYSQLTGKTFPSGISASMMKSAFPDYAKIFDSQLTAATAAAGQKVEAQKAGAAESPWKRMLDSIMGNPAEKALQQTATGGNTSIGGPKQTTPSGISYTVNQ